MARIFVALPVMGGFMPPMIESLIALLQQNPGEHDLRFDVLYNESLVSRARNRQAHRFLQTDSEYLLSIDSDLAFPADAVDRLVSHGKDIVAAPYVIKSLPQSWALRFVAGAIPPVVSGLMEVQAVSTGFTLIHRRVFEVLGEDCPTYRWGSDTVLGLYNPFVSPEDGTYLSEDWAFCHRARDKGFRCYADFDIPLKHYGLTAYEMPPSAGGRSAHSLSPIAAKADALGDRLSQLLAAAPREGAPDISAAMRDLSEGLQEIHRSVGQLARRAQGLPSAE
ncbi:MAG: hypothetical protein KGR26_08235 [Cyanobacteria bacterium REEB65]|nr:hypothetical protein [Cyanobacteria bacterium REEB65]